MKTRRNFTTLLAGFVASAWSEETWKAAAAKAADITPAELNWKAATAQHEPRAGATPRQRLPHPLRTAD